MMSVFVCKKCSRRSCKMYSTGKKNNCIGLIEVYDNDSDCPFYKKRANATCEK